MPEWLKGADCKSASESLRWFESISTHHLDFKFFSALNPFPKGGRFVKFFLLRLDQTVLSFHFGKYVFRRSIVFRHFGVLGWQTVF